MEGDRWGTVQEAAEEKGVAARAVKLAMKLGIAEYRVAEGVTLVNITEYLKRKRGRPKRSA